MSKDPLHGPAHLLVVDDEPDLLTLYELTLVREGYAVSCAGSLAEARELLAARRFDLLITDMRLPDGMGLELIRELTQTGRGERTVVVTAHGSADNAVEALKQGAFDYLTKPLDLKQFRAVVATALQRRDTPAALPGERPGPGTDGRARPPRDAGETTGSEQAQATLRNLVGESTCMAMVRERIAKVATNMAPVMILGESGTGKELVARAIHSNSHRASGPFVAVNCGAIPENLIESEFFGARKGAYTGATTDRDGYFVAARGGTLFLDEIGDLPLPMQAKLLRVIQERQVRPLGGVHEELVDVRIVCATHKDLVQAVAQQQFRQDLFYRLNVIEIRLPPLRERREDLGVLVATLLDRICRENGQPRVGMAPEASEWLRQQPLAGNVRELENLLHRAVALCDGHCIVPADFGDAPHPAQASTSGTGAGAATPPADTASANTPQAHTKPTHTQLPPSSPGPGDNRFAELPSDLQQHLDEQERAVLCQALAATHGNRTAAAALLGLNLRQIRYRIGRLNIQVGGNDANNDTNDADDLLATPNPASPANHRP
ncbi:MAG: sigma-54 dependent transcriptional regulator [Burkholderiales bacterium]|nr:sigma-54 dependent transcriptional regulator [Burkholderiales bacterium]